jgi:hypothetical protein
MRSHGKFVVVFCLVVICCVALGAAERAFSFAEEPIGFKDPRSHLVWQDDKVSTIHTDLVYALALAAGFSEEDAGTIMIWDQLVDSLKLGPGSDVVYTNCLGSTPPAPDPSDPGVCDNGGELERQIWPTKEYEDSSCTTDRHGPYATNFHWLHQTDDEIGEAKKWARGEKDHLEGWAVYAWGGYTESLLNARCQYKRWDVIDIGIRPGTLEAYATYLHMLADTYSHVDCLNSVGGLYPFVTHTQQQDDSDQCPYCSNCYYTPPIPHNGDTHGQEFGDPASTGKRAHRTYEAAIAVFNALTERSIEREGVYVPIKLADTLPMMGGVTLDQAIRNFAYTWAYQNQHLGANPGEYAENRRAYAERIAVAVGVLRERKVHEAVIVSGDYDGDGRADIGVFRPAPGLWSVKDVTRIYSPAGSYDYPVSGDYDGDETAEMAFFRPSQGLWSVQDLTRAYYGALGDLPAPGDYDGDGSCDIGIFRENGGMWSIRNLSRFYFGGTGDWPLPGDWDGNGMDEAGLYRPSAGKWMVRNISRFYLGAPTDWPIPGDYKGDNSLSAGIFRPCSGMWAIRDITRIFFGNCFDCPVPADYFGGGTTDIGVFRDATGLWAIRNLSRGYFGSTGDIPVTR